MKVYTIILAGGNGSRMGILQNKAYLRLNGKTVLRRSAEAFAGYSDEMIIVCRGGEETTARKETEGLPCPVRLAAGGKTRQDSVLSGLQTPVMHQDDIVMIHDAARCLVDRKTIEAALESCRKYGSGVASIPVTDTIKQMTGELTAVGPQPERSLLRAAQTPQCFTGVRLLECSLRARAEGYQATDDASLLEHYNYPVHYTEGHRNNIKLTTKEDIVMAESILRQNGLPFRIGQGYDVHRLVPGRRLILCGVEIPWEYGLLGHSDADVATHALMDAMLGAAALGDIGQHFPDTDERYAGVSSVLLLNQTVRILAEKGFRVSNADITIIAQQPKLAPYISQMRETISEALSLPPERVSIKATTTEKLGFTGRKEGIAAEAVCLLSESDS